MTARERGELRKSTIADVAERAGVSIKTVSRVINREPKVRQETRDRVERAITDLRYRPNSPGRMLASRRSYNLGLIYNANSSYINSIQNGALDACRSEHYDLLIHPCDYRSPDIAEEIAELVTGSKVDGLLLVPPVSDLPAVRHLLDTGNMPYVTISGMTTASGEWSVGTNDREVSASMVSYLAALGHRRIAFVRGHPDHKAMSRRYQGFLEGMQANSVDVIDGFVVQGENIFQSGIDCGRRLLQQSPRPTAVFCANDHMAAGVMAIAHESGVSLPKELSVAGFDDIPLAGQIWPALTTIRQPLREMASLAATLLIQRLRGNETDNVARVVDAELVTRASTAAPASPD